MRKFSGPFLIIAVTSPVNVTLQKSPRSKPFVVHIDKVKPYLSETPKSWIGVDFMPDQQVADSPEIIEDSAMEDGVLVESFSDRLEGSDEEVEQRPLTPVTSPSVLQDDREVETNTDEYAVDQGPQPRPRRQIHLPIRYRE